MLVLLASLILTNIYIIKQSSGTILQGSGFIFWLKRSYRLVLVKNFIHEAVVNCLE